MSALLDSASLQSESLLGDTELPSSTIATVATTTTTPNNQSVCTVIKNSNASLALDSEPVCGGDTERNSNLSLVGAGVEHVAMATTACNLDRTSSTVTSTGHIDQTEKSVREGCYCFQGEKAEMEPVTTIMGNYDTKSVDDEPVARTTFTNYTTDDGRTKNASTASVVIGMEDVREERDENDGGEGGDSGDSGDGGYGGDSGEPATMTNTSFFSPGQSECGRSHPKDILFFMRDQHSRDQIKQVSGRNFKLLSFSQIFLQPMKL